MITDPVPPQMFADSGGWGCAVFDYDGASDTFKPGTLAGTPPQGIDAKFGFACHTNTKTRARQNRFGLTTITVLIPSKRRRPRYQAGRPQNCARGRLFGSEQVKDLADQIRMDHGRIAACGCFL